MWLHDDKNPIFSVWTGSSISVGEFGTYCASLLGPGCLGRGRNQDNTEKNTENREHSLFYQCEEASRTDDSVRKCSASFTIRLEIKTVVN